LLISAENLTNYARGSKRWRKGREDLPEPRGIG
jgi:hypothetical protein